MGSSYQDILIKSHMRGQASQDAFVLKALNYKTNGHFLEIGSSHPSADNNSYLLEKYFDWKGIMVEYETHWLPQYKAERPNSIHVINDARKVDYKKLLDDNNFPKVMDYLQIDLEVENESTMDVLELLDRTIFDTYKFATITFEHDSYRGDFFNTKNRSRAIFEKRGYVRVFSDVSLKGFGEFEDWYVHPDLVNMDYINKIKTTESTDHTEIINRMYN